MLYCSTNTSFACIHCSTDITKTFILPEMEELSKDDQVDVRRMALSSLYEILPLVDEGTQYIGWYILHMYIIHCILFQNTHVLICACVMFCSLIFQSLCHWLCSCENSLCLMYPSWLCVNIH